MKSMDEVIADPDSASPIELALATWEMNARAARSAIAQDDLITLKSILAIQQDNLSMIASWVREITQ